MSSVGEGGRSPGPYSSSTSLPLSLPRLRFFLFTNSSSVLQNLRSKTCEAVPNTPPDFERHFATERYGLKEILLNSLAGHWPLFLLLGFHFRLFLLRYYFLLLVVILRLLENDPGGGRWGGRIVGGVRVIAPGVVFFRLAIFSRSLFLFLAGRPKSGVEINYSTSILTQSTVIHRIETLLNATMVSLTLLSFRWALSSSSCSSFWEHSRHQPPLRWVQEWHHQGRWAVRGAVPKINKEHLVNTCTISAKLSRTSSKIL